MRKRFAELPTLSAPQAACLDAVRSGKDRLTPIAVATRLAAKDVEAALKALHERGLIEHGPSRGRWVLTEHGRTYAQRGGGQSQEEGPNRRQVGPSGQRLLDVLVHPMSGDELCP